MPNFPKPQKSEPAAADPECETHHWFCLQTRPKSEHIAAAGLIRFEGVESFCPRIRFQKVTKRGKVWFKEALFPNYIFAKFAVDESLRAVRSSQAVLKVVGFGDYLGEVPEEVIASIREEMCGEEELEVSIPMREGDEVEVAQGPFAGMKGIVTRLMSGAERVQILMEILGQENRVEVEGENLKSDKRVRDVISGMD